MSGGVDSSVAAYLLHQAGYEVMGVTMDLFESRCRIEKPRSHRSLPAFEDAIRVAEKIGIVHHILDLKKEFGQMVIWPFLREYTAGRTPNPCVVCNKEIKFGLLLDKARDLGSDLVATGHYVRIEKTDSGYQLRKAADLSRDQSYFLYSLIQKQLSRAIFPLGDYQKEKVREIARHAGLKVAEKEESQEICFVVDNNYKGFLKERAKEKIKPGHILDREGNILGTHQGIAFYTVGQRRGLGLSKGRPLYVVKINPKDNSLTVGEEEDLYQNELLTEDVNWVGISELTSELAVLARIRYLHKESPALIYPVDGGGVRVKFKEPQRAITPGQAVVFYQDDMVLGGGRIMS